MLTTSFGHSIRRNQHCINLRSHLGSSASFVLNQLQKSNIRDEQSILKIETHRWRKLLEPLCHLQRIFFRGNEPKSFRNKKKKTHHRCRFWRKNTSYTVENLKKKQQKINLYFSIFLLIKKGLTAEKSI